MLLNLCVLSTVFLKYLRDLDLDSFCLRCIVFSVVFEFDHYDQFIKSINLSIDHTLDYSLSMSSCFNFFSRNLVNKGIRVVFSMPSSSLISKYCIVFSSFF